MSLKPEILAPCGDMPSFLAAMAGGADAVYLGLKAFSARMEAGNFSSTDLSRMVELADKHDRKIYLAFNTLIKPGDPLSAARLIARLCKDTPPHGLIVQDPAMFSLARSAGYEGRLVLSTLANVTHSDALNTAKTCGAERVVLPRELSVDEIRALDAACPEGLELEIFVHGALCWCISGRCYWSSYMGGKSGLRGRCVQPCRRLYEQRRHALRAFSCLDLSLDVLTKATFDMPNVVSWKIEGRKKGPHYVYHVTTAYRILRDEGTDPKAKKEALAILDMALGRQTTRAHFLPQRDSAPTKRAAATGSGMLIGKIHADDNGAPSFKPYQPLIPGDYLRIGTEDEPWHSTLSVTRRVPKAGTFTLRIPKHRTPKSGTPVFLIDRREPELMALIGEWKKKLDACTAHAQTDVSVTLDAPHPVRPSRLPDMHLSSQLPRGAETKRARGSIALWLTPKTVHDISRTVTPGVVWWMPPVIWPSEEDSYRRTIFEARRNGAKTFVLNSPWQASMFPIVHGLRPELIAGPFCNLTNPFAIERMKYLGFAAAIVSPELSAADFLALPKASPLPLGFVLDGFWPMGIGRHDPEDLYHNEPFRSPKGETFWTRRYGQNTWIYPAWPLDLSSKRGELEAADYSFFVHINEQAPKMLPATARPGLFNWDGALL